MATIAKFIKQRSSPRASLPSLFITSSIIVALVIFVSSIHLIIQNIAFQTRTVAGHNLDPTPWHPFDKPNNSLPSSTMLHCSYISCFMSSYPSSSPPPLKRGSKRKRSCPYFFQSIHRDLEPWKQSGVTLPLLEQAQKSASMRITIIGGRKLYVDMYYSCVQSRAMFTIWGFLQLLKRYPGMIPDVDMMFDCMDRPQINRALYRGGGNDEGLPIPPPLFRYCTSKEHWDIPFPDWSFWGWSEINIRPWDEEFKRIKIGSHSMPWEKKDATAYWKGNPDVASPIRTALLACNDSQLWGAQIMRQNWTEEAKAGFKGSELSDQCNHRYKIYAEGFAWSVSLKYILSCGSMSLIIDPYYEDFFTRGLVPKLNFWPTSAIDLCQSIKSAVDWGNSNPSEAEAIGKNAQDFMEDMNMDRVYDYMYHLISEYAKLQKFKPSPPSTAQHVCMKSVLCLADEKQRKFLESSYALEAKYFPCSLPQLLK